MPLIDTTHLLEVADRAAYQYEQIFDAFAVLQQQGNDYYFDIVTDTDDSDVEIPTVANYTLVDDTLVSEGAGFAANNGTRLSSIISSMNAHFARPDPSGQPLQAGGWDGYCQTQDVRVSDWFGQLFFATQNYYMVAVDVFSEGDDLFGTGEVIGGPAITFTDGINYGNGAVTNPANGTYFAATQLRAEVVTMGGTDLDLRLSVKDINDNPTTIDVTIPASTAPGTFIDIGTTSDRFLDLIGIGIVPAGASGTLGDEIEIRNLTERQIAL